MSKESKMVHTGGTQTTESDVPKIQNTTLRNGTYYYYARNPKELVEAGILKSHKKCSLKTKDYREAKDRAAKETITHSLEIEQLMQKHSKEQELDIQTKPSVSRLSESEQKHLVIEYFVKLEKENEKLYLRYIEEEDAGEKDELFQTIADDINAYTGARKVRIDWDEDFKNLLITNGYRIEDSLICEDAKILYRNAAKESYRRLMERITGRPYLVPDASFKDLHAASGIETITRKEVSHDIHTVDELCERYPRRKSEGKLKPSTVDSYKSPSLIMREFFGENLPLSSLNYEEGEKLVHFLAKIPLNATKRYPKLSLKKASMREAKRKSPQYLSPSSQKKNFVCIKAMLAYATEIGWLNKNPFGADSLLGMLPEITVKKQEKFTGRELTSILTSPKYLANKPSGSISKAVKAGYYWLPLLAMFTGARANELASLLVTDVKDVDSVYYLNISELNGKGEKVKNLKTKVSERRIPIHIELIKLGFITFWKERCKIESEGLLFPEMKPNKVTKNRAKRFSQWFGRLRDIVVGKDMTKGGKNFHSFRHAVTDQLRGVTVSDEMRYALLGWTEGGGKRNAGYGYGDGFALNDMQAIINKIEYPEVDLSHLYPCATKAFRMRRRE